MKVLTFAYYVCLLKIFLLRSLSFSSLYLEKFFWDFATSGVFILKIMPFQEFFSSRFAISGVFLFRIAISEVFLFQICHFRSFSLQDFTISGDFLLKISPFRSFSLQDFAISGDFLLRISPFRSFSLQDFAISGVFLFRIVTSGVCIFRILPFLEFVNLKFCLTRVCILWIFAYLTLSPHEIVLSSLRIKYFENILY